MSYSLSGGFLATLKRDLLLAFRHKGDCLNPIMFFVITITLFPLGISAEAAFLSQLAPGLLWVAALLAVMLSLDNLFRTDHDDGTLEQLLVSPQPLFILVLAKVFAHWIISGLPLVLLSPVLAIMLHLPTNGISVLVLSLLLGTPTMSFLGGIGVALTLGVNKGGLLVSLLVLPLYIPILIFGSNAVQTAVSGLPVIGHLSVLGALLAVSITIVPFAIGAALRVSSE